MTPLHGHIEVIAVARYDGKPVDEGVLPNCAVVGLLKADREYVPRARERDLQPGQEQSRQVFVKEKFQRGQ